RRRDSTQFPIRRAACAPDPDSGDRMQASAALRTTSPGDWACGEDGSARRLQAPPFVEDCDCVCVWPCDCDCDCGCGSAAISSDCTRSQTACVSSTTRVRI